MGNKKAKKRTVQLNKPDRVQAANYRRLLLKYLRLSNKAFLKNVYEPISKKYEGDKAQKESIRFKNDLIKGISAFVLINAQLINSAIASARANLEKQEEINSRNFGKLFERITKSNLESVYNRKNTKAALDLAIEENVNLIKSLSEQTKTRLISTILSQQADGVIDMKKWLDDIRKTYEVSSRRATLIVRDQTHKLLSSINRLRLQNLGVESYIWRNMGDERVRGNPVGKYPNARPSHWAREGKEYRFDSPPSDGHPGMPINCRCVMEPIITDIIPTR